MHGGGVLSQRVTIYDLWDELQRDPSYRDRDLVQEIANSIRSETLDVSPTFNLNPQLVAIGLATDPVFRLISVLCGLCGLSTYESGKPRPIGWSGQKFADRCHLDLEVDLDELEKIFRKYELPLPKAWFPDDTDEQQEKADLEAVTLLPDAVTEESSTPVLCFYKKGEHWWIGEKERKVSINKMNGLCFIHFLLSYPYEEFRPEFVYKLGVTSEVGEVKIDYDELESKGAFSQKKLDGKARSAYVIRRKELLGRLEAQDYQDGEEYIEIKEEINQLQNQLKGKKIRNHTSDEQKARVNVSKNISRALKKIHKIVPSLEQYLNKHTIKTGDSCSYRPLSEDRPDWILYPDDLN